MPNPLSGWFLSSDLYHPLTLSTTFSRDCSSSNYYPMLPPWFTDENVILGEVSGTPALRPYRKAHIRKDYGSRMSAALLSRSCKLYKTSNLSITVLREELSDQGPRPQTDTWAPFVLRTPAFVWSCCVTKPSCSVSFPSSSLIVCFV